MVLLVVCLRRLREGGWVMVGEKAREAALLRRRACLQRHTGQDLDGLEWKDERTLFLPFTRLACSGAQRVGGDTYLVACEQDVGCNYARTVS